MVREISKRERERDEKVLHKKEEQIFQEINEKKKI
jgi:hypothetical protein